MINNNSQGFIKSMFSALSPQRLSLKLLWVFVVITIFSVKELIMNLNLWSIGQITIFKAILDSYLNGTRIIYSSVWDFFTLYILNKTEIPKGDLIFGILFIIAGFLILYQISSIIIDILDVNVGDIGSPFLKLGLAFVLLFVFSAIIHFTGGESYIGQNIIDITNQTILNSSTLINQTNVTATINLS